MSKIRGKNIMKKFVTLALILIMIVTVQCVFAEGSCKEDENRDKFIQVESDSRMMFAIDQEFRLWAWGYNGDQLIDNTTYKHIMAPKLIMRDVKNVALGNGSVYVIKTDDSLWSWGVYNKSGQLGYGNNETSLEPRIILHNVKSIDVSSWETVAAITTYGDLYMWGSNHKAQIGDTTHINRNLPKKIRSNVESVIVGCWLTIATQENGDVVVWGDLSRDEYVIDTVAPLVIAKDIEEISIAATKYYDLYMINKAGELLGVKIMSWDREVKITKISSNVDSISSVQNARFGVLGKDGVLTAYDMEGYLTSPTVYCLNVAEVDGYLYKKRDQSLWYYYDEADQPTIYKPKKISPKVKQFWNFGEYNMLVTEDDKVYTWGKNFFGRLGVGDTESRESLKKIFFDENLNKFTGLNYKNHGSIRVNVDGKDVAFDVKPTVIDNRTLVPVKAIFEELGLKVEWDGKTRTVTGTSNDYNIKFTIGDKTTFVNGVEKNMDVSAMIIDGRTLIPLRFLSENMGYNVVWVADSKLILLSKGNVCEWRYSGLTSYNAKYETLFVNGVDTGSIRHILD